MFLPDAVGDVLNRLEGAGYGAWAVGGCVRDQLLNRRVSDWDVCTQALPEQVARVFEGTRVLETGLQHGTVTLLTQGLAIEVTTLRADGAYPDHRRPEKVRFVRELEKDLARRDFTVNAMAYREGEGLTDLFGGQEDLKRRVIRCVGCARARFEEDALRILRAVRFAAQLDFFLEEATGRAVRDGAGTLAYVSAERIYAELLKLLAGPGAARVLGLYNEVTQEVLPGARADQAEIASLPPDPALRLALILADAQPLFVMARLKADRRTTEKVAYLCAEMKSAVPEDRAGALRLLGRAGGYPLAREVCALWRAKARDVSAVCKTLDQLEREGACYRVRDLSVGGGDIARMGFSGEAIGKTLEMLRQKVIEGTLPNERAALLSEAARQMNEPNT
ncbi:MAG: tRNA nucleotidyltransferase [Clostridia bacterium]